MPFSFRRFSTTKMFTLALSIFAAVTTLAFGARHYLASPPIIEPAVLQNHGTPASSPLKSVLFTIHTEGFEPNEITLPAGKYVLAVDNRSGSEDVQLNLRRGQSEKLKEAKLSRKQMDWNSVIELTPGQYSLSDLNRPKWSANIKVSPK